MFIIVNAYTYRRNKQQYIYRKHINKLLYKTIYIEQRRISYIKQNSYIEKQIRSQETIYKNKQYIKKRSQKKKSHDLKKEVTKTIYKNKHTISKKRSHEVGHQSG